MTDLTYKLQRLSDYPVIPSTERLIDPYLPLGGQIVLAALPKTFKTFVALYWACCVATGHLCLGRPVKKGKVLYIALESYYGVLRRKEAWRKKHGYTKADLDNLVCITVPINFAKDGSIDMALADLCAQGFRPDFIVIDTWFKSTAGAKVNDQAEMTAALDRLTAFQKTLEKVTEFKDALPLVTVLILAHTDKKGIDLFGSVAQFANCDVLYMLNRQEHAPGGHPFLCWRPRHRGTGLRDPRLGESLHRHREWPRREPRCCERGHHHGQAGLRNWQRPHPCQGGSRFPWRRRF